MDGNKIYQKKGATSFRHTSTIKVIAFLSKPSDVAMWFGLRERNS
jgi:hypothetical protein